MHLLRVGLHRVALALLPENLALEPLDLGAQRVEVEELGRGVPDLLRGFPAGVYLTDVYPEVEGHRFASIIRASNHLLRTASRSRFMLHFSSDPQMQAHFVQQGFRQATVFNPDQEKTAAPAARGGAIVRVVRASA